MKIANNIAELIGNTPLVRLNGMNPSSNVTIALKLEFFNPAHSVKDRIAVSMIDAAEKAGKIKRSKRDWRGWRIYDKDDLKNLKQFKETIVYYGNVKSKMKGIKAI